MYLCFVFKVAMPLKACEYNKDLIQMLKYKETGLIFQRYLLGDLIFILFFFFQIFEITLFNIF